MYFIKIKIYAHKTFYRKKQAINKIVKMDLTDKLTARQEEMTGRVSRIHSGMPLC